MPDPPRSTISAPMPGPACATTTIIKEQKYTSTFNFLALPYEIRTKIYLYALVCDQAFLWPTPLPLESLPIPAPPESSSQQDPQQQQAHTSSSHTINSGLLTTCRQIHAEATPFLYNSNRLSFTHPSDLNIFTLIMSRPHTHLLTHVGFHVREKDIPLWLNYFTSVDPVRSLSADLPSAKTVVVFLSLNAREWWGYREPGEVVRTWTGHTGVRRICMGLEGRLGSAGTCGSAGGPTRAEGIEGSNTGANERRDAAHARHARRHRGFRIVSAAVPSAATTPPPPFAQAPDEPSASSSHNSPSIHSNFRTRPDLVRSQAAQITLLATVRCTEQAFRYLRISHVPETLTLVGEGVLRTRSAEIAGVRCSLEILCDGLGGSGRRGE